MDGFSWKKTSIEDEDEEVIFKMARPFQLDGPFQLDSPDSRHKS